MVTRHRGRLRRIMSEEFRKTKHNSTFRDYTFSKRVFFVNAFKLSSAVTMKWAWSPLRWPSKFALKYSNRKLFPSTRSSSRLVTLYTPRACTNYIPGWRRQREVGRLLEGVLSVEARQSHIAEDHQWIKPRWSTASAGTRLSDIGMGTRFWYQNRRRQGSYFPGQLDVSKQEVLQLMRMPLM
jgi:hypothetical protein